MLQNINFVRNDTYFYGINFSGIVSGLMILQAPKQSIANFKY